MDTKEFDLEEAITLFYCDMMKIASREHKKLFGDVGDFQDVAHDTIMKIYEKIDGQKVTRNFLLSYFCKAVRMNYIRSTMYACYKNLDFNDYLPMDLSTNSKEEYKIDYNVILLDLESQFGPRDSTIFNAYMSGYTLKEINQKWGINNSDYIIRKLKKYIKENYKDYELKRHM